MKAWRIVWPGLPDEVGIYIASTAGKARAMAHRQLHEAGYKGRWTELRVRRAPEYDRWAERQPERRRQTGITEEWVRQELRSALSG